MISVEGLTVEFGGFTLFDDVSFVVNKKDRIALVGKNGAGKSTMLKIFASCWFSRSISFSISWICSKACSASSRTVCVSASFICWGR